MYYECIINSLVCSYYRCCRCCDNIRCPHRCNNEPSKCGTSFPVETNEAEGFLMKRFMEVK